MRTQRLIAVFAVLLSHSIAFGETPDANRASIGINAIDQESMEMILKDKKVRWPIETGPVVIDVFQDSPAAAAGMSELDMILAINDQRIRTAAEMSAAIAALEVGEVAAIRIQKVSGKISPKWSRKTVKVTPEKRKDVLLAALDVTHDDVKRVDYYRHPKSPKSAKDGTAVFAYFAIDNGKPLPLQIVFQRNGRRFLGIRSFDLRIGPQLITVNPQPLGVKSDIDSTVAEWYHHTADKELLNALSKASSLATCRFNGVDYFEDHEMDVFEMYRLKLVISAWQAVSAD